MIPLRIAFAGASGTGKTTLAKWLISPDGPCAGLPLCPVGSRSVAAEMGFVGHDGEGRPYAVDKADEGVYIAVLRDLGLDPGRFARAARWAMPGNPAWETVKASVTGRSMRAAFQRKLAEDKIAWESTVEMRTTYIVGADTPRFDPAGPPRAFVTDRTPLDDCAYAILHCPEVVTEAFVQRAVAHVLNTYDAIFFCPIEAGQWLDKDASRVEDHDYHFRYEVVLLGLLHHAGLLPLTASSSAGVQLLDFGDLDERKEYIAADIARLRR